MPVVEFPPEESLVPPYVGVGGTLTPELPELESVEEPDVPVPPPLVLLLVSDALPGEVVMLDPLPLLLLPVSEDPEEELLLDG